MIANKWGLPAKPKVPPIPVKKQPNRSQLEKKAKALGYNHMDVAKMKKIADEAAKKMEREATEKALLYMLAIPLNVLVNDYWKKSAKKRAPRFIADVCSLFESVQSGAVTDLELREFLDEYADIRIEAEWIKEADK